MKKVWGYTHWTYERMIGLMDKKEFLDKITSIYTVSRHWVKERLSDTGNEEEIDKASMNSGHLLELDKRDRGILAVDGHETEYGKHYAANNRDDYTFSGPARHAVPYRNPIGVNPGVNYHLGWKPGSLEFKSGKKSKRAKGWKLEPARHALSAKGIKTKRLIR
jgi:hypothetical protein